LFVCFPETLLSRLFFVVMTNFFDCIFVIKTRESN
jgi:hypothetical protein